ncbi:MAG: hypothetical protein QOH53_33, partial [Ilumatobacteraceae bacterium]
AVGDSNGDEVEICHGHSVASGGTAATL